MSKEDLKILGLKSYYCHVLMQDLLLVATRGILPKISKQVIIHLYIFFNAICRKVIDPNRLEDLENEVVIILCQLEMYFLPYFLTSWSI